MIIRLEDFASRHPVLWLIIGLVVIAGIGTADYLTGNELSFALFYLIPISMVTWLSGRNFGLFLSVVAIATWFCADLMAGHGYSEAFIPYWNAVVRFAMFVAITLLLPVLRELEHEKAIARVDALTGVANRRHFLEVARAELERSQRYNHPFTVAYIDLDNFKAVNDQFGHVVGDTLLCTVARQMSSQLRKTDLLARMGGDEFVLLLPELDQGTARIIVPKYQATLLEAMQSHDWPVTFSIGVLTYAMGDMSIDAFLKRADDLMYTVKNGGKNGIAYAEVAGPYIRTPGTNLQSG